MTSALGYTARSHWAKKFEYSKVKPCLDRAFKLCTNKEIGTKHGQKPVSVMLPLESEGWVKSHPNCSEWIRQAILEKHEREQVA
jgi:hypothetical protein